MNTLIKYPQRQDCHFKLSAGNSGETSINLSTEIALFLNDGKTLSQGEEIPVSFILYKEDFIKAICHIVDKLPLFKTSSTSSTKVEYSNSLFLEYINSVNAFFGNSESASYNVTLSAVSAPRYYLKNLNNNGFNLRKFLTENNSTLYFSKEEGGFVIRLSSGEVKPEDKELDFNDDLSLVIKNKVLKKFVLETLIYLQEHETLDSLYTYASSGPLVKISSVEHSFSLTGMFLESTLEDVQIRNTPRARWFEEPLFHVKNRNFFLSDQWYGEGNFQLTLVDFEKMIKVCFNNKYIVKTDTEGIFELWRIGNAPSLPSLDPSQCIKYIEIITAAKTKPFILLAGISGTGKSRIVRELAFMSCPKYLQDKDGVTPGNYCMIEVKPNWHDSTELLGYYSNISREYQFKKFVKFLVKAKMHPEVPFFVCLDEMNLAPVEQYFAEILSILETRKHPKTDEGVDMDRIKTEVIVESKYFKSYTYKDEAGALHDRLDMTDKDWYETFFNVTMMTDQERELINGYQYSRTLQQEGLSLPDNVIIIGTVNMDETTHQFSRKVIDRAMTIEMNGGRLSNMFGGSKRLEYLPEVEQQKWQGAFKQCYVSADEVLELHPEAANDIKEKLPVRLDDINKALKGTPFEVSYRVLNELVIMVGVMLDYNTEGKDIDAIINEAVDRILLMKILPRVEGDNEMFALSHAEQQKYGVKYANRLEWLLDLAPEISVTEDADADHQQTAKEKIQEMIDRLESREFTRYWP